MKIAVPDAALFMDIYELHLTTELFSLDIDIHTSQDIFNQLYPHQKELLKVFQSIGKLSVHIITEEDRKAIFKQSYPIVFSFNEKTVLYLAEKIDAMILSCDKPIRQFAKKKAIEHHGMIWILDRLMAASKINGKQASLKLKKFVSTNSIYQNNAELILETEKRFKLWNQ